MTNSVKERISADLERAKAEGNLRTERIRSIVRDAIAQAGAEVKGGVGEVGAIAREAIAAVIGTLGERGKELREDITASVEGVVDGIRDRRESAIAETQTQIDQLQTTVDVETQQIEAEVEGALVEMQKEVNQAPNSLRETVENAIKSIKERKEFAALQQQAARLRAQLAVIDANLAARYGDRYEEVKQHLDDAKSWYEKTKTDVAATGTDPIERRRASFETKMGEVGTAIAQKEERVKELLKELWHTVTKV